MCTLVRPCLLPMPIRVCLMRFFFVVFLFSLSLSVLIAFTQFQWAMGKHITERKLIEMGCKFADHLFTHLIYESMVCRIIRRRSLLFHLIVLV